MTRNAWGFGLSVATSSTTLSVWYPEPRLGAAGDDPEPPQTLARQRQDTVRNDIAGTASSVVLTEIDLDAPPASVDDAYLRLHLLSHRLVEPNTINLEGLFGVLPIVAWTNYGAVAPDDLPAIRSRLNAKSRALTVLSVDKFPRMVDFVVPSGVRIGDADRVRLGAHLAEGTTVMHEGFVNFNAGTVGRSMVEGRISQGVVVGDGSDLGGGASIMGTLSGGGREVISIGQRCLIGANAGLGISLGDDCVVEAGLYVTAGTKVLLHVKGTSVPDESGVMGDPQSVAARTLSGSSGLLFRRNSVTGSVEAMQREGVGVTLNTALHA